MLIARIRCVSEIWPDQRNARSGASLLGEIVRTRNQLMDAAYQDDIYVDDRTIDSHIKRLRRQNPLRQRDLARPA
jgi:hypothetical protein